MSLSSPRWLVRSGRLVAGLGLGLVALALAGAIWEAIAERLDRRAIPFVGRLVDAGGHRLHVVVSGVGQRGPVVILESGIGGATSASWGWVEPAVAVFAPVVAYDRAGLGWSDPGPLPRDTRRLATELHAALASAGLSGPYVYVGHSYGGLIARMFTHLYPAEVAGLVLVESSHPAQFGGPRRRGPRWLGPLAASLPAAPFLARIGVMRAALLFLPTDIDQLPPRDRAEQRAFMSSAPQWRGIVAELRAWAPLTNREVGRLDGLGSRPVVVLTAGRSARRWGAWARFQGRNAALSTDGVQRVVVGASHGSIVADPRYAKEVVAAVRDVVEAVRTRRPLAGDRPR